MRTIIFLFISVLCFCLLSECKDSNDKTETVIIYCDHFPMMKIDSIAMDTFSFKKYINEKLEKHIHDSIIFRIECPENIVIDNILNTELILKNQINTNTHFKVKFRIENECLANLTSPNMKTNTIKADLLIRIDGKGNLLLNDTTIALDNFCWEFKGRVKRIEIIVDETLSVEKLVKIMERLMKEGYLVSLSH